MLLFIPPLYTFYKVAAALWAFWEYAAGSMADDAIFRPPLGHITSVVWINKQGCADRLYDRGR
jgi:hypothetical protein